MNIHQKLLNDCIVLGHFKLNQLLLMNDMQYPWFILVPDRPNIREIHQLSLDEQVQLVRESSQLAVALEEAFAADKLNIAALGNIVPQLHIHHIARYETDPAWPNPVWGACPPIPYSEADRAATISKLIAALGPGAGFVQASL